MVSRGGLSQASLRIVLLTSWLSLPRESPKYPGKKSQDLVLCHRMSLLMISVGQISH